MTALRLRLHTRSALRLRVVPVYGAAVAVAAARDSSAAAAASAAAALAGANEAAGSAAAAAASAAAVPRMRYGAGAPSSGLGVDGDFYINTNTDTLYGPKASGVWPAGTSLVGPAGPQGPAGINGWVPSAADRYQYSTGAGIAVEGIITAAARALVGSAAVVDLVSDVFHKADPYSVAFLRTGAGAVSLKAGTTIGLAGLLYQFAVDTAVQMPTLAAGTDYAIYICNDGTLRADASFSAPTGFTVANSRRIGGFHYAPGGNATGTSGGDTTPQINPYSVWDIKFRPACNDPRGMTLVAGGFWCDIYLTGVDHHVNGTSRYNVTIADGSSPPKIPTAFGGNGSTTYSTLTWWEAAEVLAAAGKQLLSYDEFAAAAYGTTENTSGGTDPVSTILRQAYTSRWGVMLAAGNMFVWGRNFGGGAEPAAWVNNTGGRGQTYQQENAVLLGGAWGVAANGGSRAAVWNSAPSVSSATFGARGRCDHLCHVWSGGIE
jgi:hypothetical protein